jgi:hypothetical protein
MEGDVVVAIGDNATGIIFEPGLEVDGITGGGESRPLGGG